MPALTSSLTSLLPTPTLTPPSRSSSPSSPLTFSSHVITDDDDDGRPAIMAPPLSDPPSPTSSRSSAPRRKPSNRDMSPQTTTTIPLPPDDALHSPHARSSPYPHAAAAASTSTLKPLGSPLARGAPSGPRTVSSSSSRRAPSSSGDPSSSNSALHSDVSSVRRLAASNASQTSLAGTKDPVITTSTSAASPKPKPAEGTPRVRTIPRLPAGDAEPAPPSVMYWSKAPVWGTLPSHSMRAHSVTLVDNTAWLFGGCDEKGCWKDVWTFNTETMQWSRPDTQGEIPPPCRAHTATLVDRKLIVFGGGEGAVYYNSVYVFDLVLRHWSKPTLATADVPPPRRAHTSVYYQGKVWVFGGGNGMQALNDLWTLDVSGPVDKMKWESIDTGRKRPSPRGYHTANLIGNVMIILGGSDGRECFSDVWCLNLDTCLWTQIKPEVTHRRLSHSVTQVGSYLFITGGHDGTEYTSELLLFNLVSLQYEPRPTLGKPPNPRGYHVSLLADSRLFIFGGFNGYEVYDDVHILDLAAAAYLPQVTSFKIDA